MAPLSITNEATASNSSSASHTTRLTPEIDSEDSDLDLGEEELAGDIELRERDSEKASGRRQDDGDDIQDEARSQYRRRGSASTTQSFQLYTPDEERAVIRKFDRRLVLFVHILYMLSFLDRSSM